MTLPANLLFGLWRWMFRCGVVLILLIILAVPVGRWLFPRLADHRAILEQNLSTYLQGPVQIQQLETRWRGWEPVFSLHGFRLLDPNEGTILASFEHALLSLDLPASLLNARPIFNHVRLAGLRLRVDRTGHLRLLTGNADASTPVSDLLPWLFRIRSLDLLADDLQFQGMDNTPHHFSDLRLSLRREKNKQRLGLALNLSESGTNQIQATLETEGQPRDPSTWVIRFYVQGHELPLADLPSSPKFLTGRTTMELWGSWRHQAFQEAFGRVRFHDLAFADRTSESELPAHTKLPDSIGQFRWHRENQGWQWQSDWQIGESGQPSPVRTTVDLTATSEQERQQLHGRVQHLPIHVLTTLATPWLETRQRNLLTELDPSGEIPELTFRLQEPFATPNFSSFENFSLTARFKELAIHPQETLPEITGLRGQLSWRPTDGQLDLDTSKLEITDAPWLRRSVNLDNLRGSLRWQRQASGWRLETGGIELGNVDLTAQLGGDLTLFEDGRSPLLDLKLNYQHVDLGRVQRYLPAPLMKPKLVAWLDRALVAGQATGDLIFRGHPADFPFTQNQGLFETRFQVADATLDYRPDWPPIKALEASVVIRNRTFAVQAAKGRIFDTEITQAQARIDNLAKAVLEIHGKAEGQGETFLRFLRESPLQRKVGGYVADMQATGANTLDLDMTIPLDPRPPKVKGTVGFTGGDVDLSRWQTALTEIEGELDFTHNSLAARDIKLRLQGEPADLDIETEQDQAGGQETRFIIHSRLNPQTLLGQQGAALDPYLDGKSQWRAVLAIPAVPPGTPMTFSLNLQSDLKGITVDLPPPLGKSSREPRPFTADARFDPNHTLRVQLDYGSDVQAAVEFLEFPARSRLSQGEVRIGTGPAQLPGTPGLTLAVRLPRFELPALEGNTDVPSATLFPTWLTAADIQLGELLIGNQRFSQLMLQARQQDEILAVTLDSHELTGRLSIPVIPSPEKPVEVNLERVTLGNHANSGETANLDFDPRILPPLWIVIDNLILTDRPLGQLRLSLIPRPRGINIANLVLQSKWHRLTATGDWILTDQGPLSRLHARLHSTDLGKTLTLLGIDSAMAGGETEAEFEGEWSAAFPQVSPDQLRGQLSLHIEKGQLLDVEPGVGRMLGLFNIKSLARRVNLDFRDLYEEGMGFDSIGGHFTFQNGYTHTDDLTILAPAANILIQGQVDLKNKAYDHIITVIPQLGSPLTIAGAIAGGPAVGAAMFLAEQVLKSEIEQITRYQYTVTGSWDNPVITRLQPSDQTAEPPFADNRSPVEDGR